MDRPETQAKTDLVESVLALVRSRVAVGQAVQAEEFVRQFFRQVDPDDLRKREPADLCGAVSRSPHINMHPHNRGSLPRRMF